VEQWDFIDLDQSFEPQELPDIIHATHQFARITGFVEGANVVFDEQPAFRLDTDSERLRDGIESFLREVEAPIETWDEFVLAATNKECTLGLSGLCEAVRSDPSSEWYFDNSEAHVYIPAIVRALVDADHVGNNRYAGEVEHQPFYRGGGESESGMERVMVVLNERHEFELIKITPPLHSTRCVIGLDAHPDLERWRLDTLPSMTVEQVLCDEERHNWRRFERGLFVIQVGESDRPLTRADNFSEGKTSALIDELTEEMPELRTAITSKAVEEQIGELLPDSDVSEPVLHYGEELSRNDFADERTGLLVGCIDPGDDTVLNWLAIQGAEAAPERSNQTCGECNGSGCYECLDTGYKRERGRGFRGPDADAAEALVASVRETHVAQAIGRYARDADHPDEPTVVFVWTAAIPDEMVDNKIPDVRSFTDNQERVVEYVCENGPVPTREIADALDLTKEAARTTLSELAEMGPVAIERCAGKHGAHLYDIDRSVEGFLYLDDYDEGEATTATTTATRTAAEG
jgi:hypothetical protein